VSTSPDGRPPLRIGTLEREAACAALDAHLTAGRLDAEEYGERYAKASLARDHSELDALFVDLPAPHWAPPRSPGATWPSHWPQQPQDDRGRYRQAQWQRYLPASVFGRIIAAIAFIALAAVIIPPLAVGALIWFVVIPAMGGRGCGSRRYRNVRGRAWYA